MPQEITPAVQDYLKTIHARAGGLAQRRLLPLDRCQAGQRVIIREVQDDNPERLRRWQTLGLTPGAVVRVLSYQPLDDMFQLEVGDAVIPVGSEGLAGL